MKRLIILLSTVAMISFLLLGALQSKRGGYVASKKVTTNNSALVLSQPAMPLPTFSFKKAGKVAFTNQSLKGKWSLLFIGYTFCPDVCPTTLADLDRVYPSLKNDSDTTTQVVFISVDPNRDKADLLADYVHYFNKDFIGVTSSQKQLWPFVTELGLIYSLVEEGETDEYYLVDHSASIVLINPAGELHATFKSVVNDQGINHVDMDLMVEDIKKIQSQYL